MASRTAAAVAARVRAAQRAQDIGPTIRKLQAAGKTSPHAIASELNRQGIRTSRGRGPWSAAQVQRILARLD
jgi:hypothetical protein